MLMNIDERISSLENQLTDYDSKIASLNEMMKDLDQYEKKSDMSEISDLQKKSLKARERMNELKLKKAQSWEDESISDAVIEIFDDIGKRLDKLFKRYS